MKLNKEHIDSVLTKKEKPDVTCEHLPKYPLSHKLFWDVEGTTLDIVLSNIFLLELLPRGISNRKATS
jgi:hypothetical protein